MHRFLLVLFALIIVTACSKEKRLMKDISEKEWAIETSKRWVIYNDGETTQYEDQVDAGTIYVYTDPNSPLEFKDVRMVYTNFTGASTDFTTAFYANEDGTRVGMAGVLCSSPFECDLVFNVEKSSNNRQVWTAYGSDNVFFFPPDMHTANKDHHLKWELTLKKVGKFEVE